ncbi:MAG: BTAD domain-containing putative transcriptional regulator, partial [Chloroflexota bacterium]
MDEGVKKLRVLVLGPPLVLHGDQRLNVKRRLLRAMFFYLASQPEAVGRGTLMDLFWPEESEEDTRRHIREALSKLRSELPDPGLLISTQDHVRLDPENTYVDVIEYLALVDQVRPYLQRRMSTPLPEAIYQQMVKAVSLWRGNEFLAGTTLPSTEGLDHWLSLTSQSLTFSYQNLLETLSEHCAVSGDLENAVYWVRRAIELDEENPDLYYRLISWLRDLGRRSEALGVCEQVSSMYAALGEKLPVVIQTLVQQVREEISTPPVQPVAPWHNTLTLQL